MLGAPHPKRRFLVPQEVLPCRFCQVSNNSLLGMVNSGQVNIGCFLTGAADAVPSFSERVTCRRKQKWRKKEDENALSSRHVLCHDQVISQAQPSEGALTTIKSCLIRRLTVVVTNLKGDIPKVVSSQFLTPFFFRSDHDLVSSEHRR